MAHAALWQEQLATRQRRAPGPDPAPSQGPLDLVSPAARIGLVRLVPGARRPPLVLDDPFVTLDDDRARRALDVLKAISADFQVIYLTPSDPYDAAARGGPGPHAPPP